MRGQMQRARTHVPYSCAILQQLEGCASLALWIQLEPGTSPFTPSSATEEPLAVLWLLAPWTTNRLPAASNRSKPARRLEQHASEAAALAG